MTVEKVAKAAGVHPIAVHALSGLLARYRVGRKYTGEAVIVTAVADELAAAVNDGQMSEAVAARVLARVAP